MSDYNRYQTGGSENEYQPVIDRLREIAARGLNMEGGSADPARLGRHEPAASGDGRMMNGETPDLQQLMSNPDVLARVLDWMQKEGLMEQPMQQSSSVASVPGMPPPQSFADGSTPYSRLQERINNIGRGKAPSRGNGNGNDAY